MNSTVVVPALVLLAWAIFSTLRWRSAAKEVRFYEETDQLVTLYRDPEEFHLDWDFPALWRDDAAERQAVEEFIESVNKEAAYERLA